MRDQLNVIETKQRALVTKHTFKQSQSNPLEEQTASWCTIEKCLQDITDKPTINAANNDPSIKLSVLSWGPTLWGHDDGPRLVSSPRAWSSYILFSQVQGLRWAEVAVKGEHNDDGDQDVNTPKLSTHE